MPAAACAATLLIVAGQSNAVGFGVGPADLPAHVRPDPKARIWTGGGFETLRPGVNTGGPQHRDAWGPEAEFARRYRRDHPDRTLYVVKVAKGSTGLAADPREPDWSPSSGELFAHATQAVRAARRAIGEPVDTAILWHQGERDAADPRKAAAYAANLAGLRAAILAAWGDRRARLIVARINGVRFGGSPVRAAQAGQGAYSTDGFPLQNDRLHLTAAGQVLSGAAAYAEYRRRPGPCEAPARRGP